MFRIIMVGKTIKELREKAQEFLNEMKGNENSDPTISQEPISRTATETLKLRKEQFAPNVMSHFEPVPMHIPAQPVTEPNPFAGFPMPTVSVQSGNNESGMVGLPAAPVGAVQKPSVANEYGLDSRGLPWDARIHAVTQGVNKDGSWRNRRGVEQTLINQVETELRTRIVNSTVAIPAIPQAPVAPPPFVPQFAPPPAQPAPVVQPTPTAPASVAQLPSAHTFETFKANLIAVLNKLVTDGKLNQEYIASLKAYFMVEQIWQVSDVQALEMFKTFCDNGLLVKAQ